MHVGGKGTAGGTVGTDVGEYKRKFLVGARMHMNNARTFVRHSVNACCLLSTVWYYTHEIDWGMDTV